MNIPQTALVLIFVDAFTNGRDVADLIIGKNYNTTDDILNELSEHLIAQEGYEDGGNVHVYSMDNFAEECNNQDIELETYWVTHVTLNTEI